MGSKPHLNQVFFIAPVGAVAQKLRNMKIVKYSEIGLASNVIKIPQMERGRRGGKI
ncbi:hypothetical protein SAMN05660649_00864 [Desulfotomaculum arcticum]|uniref:Uncharacterized protein n=1 Tax=Desulfotruncus arcticus DSM 17038 TaxID=1121424 RepID=A0A1I2PHF3_9FIRM|nr:hypothetical protein SAMN05660649_00864 [Desulfotomaculum arcticum] [Desulfotruncus arcticus DSM 17038]